MIRTENGQNDTYGLAVDGVEVLTKSIGTLEGFFECFGLYPGSDAMTFMDDGTARLYGVEKIAEKAKEARDDSSGECTRTAPSPEILSRWTATLSLKKQVQDAVVSGLHLCGAAWFPCPVQ